MTKKFRVWDKKAGKFLISHKDKGLLFGTRHLWQGIEAFVDNENFIVQQFITLHDKNGHELYDGDIIRVTSTTQEFGEAPVTAIRHAKIFWCKNGAWWEEYLDWVYTCSGNRDGQPIEGWITPAASEVIGNICERPDLLKELTTY